MDQKDYKVVYPAGVKNINEDMSTDDLVERLQECAQAFQNMSEDDDNSAYLPLALYLASENFLEHPSQEIRILVACCMADVFRVYAHDVPYKDSTQLKVIFEFFVEELHGLEDPSNVSFNRYRYLLENFSSVKTFNNCLKLEDNHKILCRLFELMFKVIHENDCEVKKLIVDMLSHLISEADVVSNELLDVIVNKLFEPTKTQNPNACCLAWDILDRNKCYLDRYIESLPTMDKEHQNIETVEKINMYYRSGINKLKEELRNENCALRIEEEELRKKEKELSVFPVAVSDLVAELEESRTLGDFFIELGEEKRNNPN